MQKVIELLERHVQWVALGLGAVWLLLMTWTYVINPPAKVEIGSEVLKAGQVDEYTVANAVKPLEEAMKPHKEPPPMEVQDFATRWLTRMDWKEAEPIATPGIIASAPPMPEEMFPRPRAPQPLVPGPQQPPVAAAIGVPKPLPVPTVDAWRFGRSTAIVPPPIIPVGQPQPAVPAQPAEVDKDWITQSFKVSLPQIAELFKKHQIPPPPVGMTAFLKVEMVRQELNSGGQWVNETVMQPLNTGVVRQPFPAPKAGIHQENAYLNWAVQNTGDIVQPAFYQTVLNKGDIWERPGEPVQPVAGAGGFNPQQFLQGPIPENLNANQRRQIMDARRAAAAQRRAQERQNRPVRTPRGRGREGIPEMEDPTNYAPKDSERPKFLQARQYPPRPYPGAYPPGAFPPGMDPSMMEDPAMMEGEFMEQPPPPAIMGVGVPDVDYPAGQFDPATWHLPPPAAPGAPPPVNPRPAEVSIWAHDDTVQPGKTYRYKARYFLKNPLFQQPGAVKNPAAARQFAIDSPFSEWGPAIEVPPLTNFFIANVPPNATRVRFDVYTWKQGQNHHTTITAGPGDAIAKSDGGVDFSTGHIVVDLRTDLRSRDPVVYLANGGAGAVVRTPRGDANNPVYKKLQEVVKAAAALQQAAVPPR